MAPSDRFVYSSKRAKLDMQRSTTSSSDVEEELVHSTSFASLPADLLARIAAWVRVGDGKCLHECQAVAYAARSAPGERAERVLILDASRCFAGTAAVLALGTTCKRLRSACEPFIFDKLTLETAQATVQAVEELGGLSTTKKSPTSPGSRIGPLKHLKELSIKSVQVQKKTTGPMKD
jgi:hypothetical protein